MTDSLKLQRSRSQRFPWVWVIVGLLVLALIALAAAPQSYPGGSTYGKKLGDYSQWYAFMERQGHPIRRWQKPYSQLKESKNQGQTFIQIADVEALAEPLLQSSEILDWVERGNTLIQLNWADLVTGAPFVSDLRSEQGSIRIETSRRHKLGSTRSADGSTEVKEVAEVKDAFGSVIWSSAYGKGQIILSNYPWVAANVYAQREGNFRVLEALVTRQDGTIWVDEWLHGHQDRTSESNRAAAQDEQLLWVYLSRQPITVVAGQGIVLLLLLLWGKNQRFGALTRLTVPPRNSSEQYIQALADTLDANGHTEYVLTLLGQAFRQRLQTQLGMGGIGRAEAALADKAIAQQWSSVTGRSPQVLLELLEQTQREKRLSERALLTWVQNSEAILRGLS